MPSTLTSKAKQTLKAIQNHIDTMEELIEEMEEMEELYKRD